jgi:hypothetical protein
MHKLKYSEPKPFSRQEALEILEGKNIKQICDVLIGITFHGNDRKWIESILINNSKHNHPDVRGLVATCIGHVARIFGKLSSKTMMPILRNLLKDSNDYVRGCAMDAEEDIKIFIKRKIKSKY